MALKNAYKNKLMGARTTPLSSYTKVDDTDPLAPTDNNGERDKYNLGIASLDKEKTNQNIYDAYNAYQNSPLNLGNLWNGMVNNVKQNAVNTVAERNNAAASEATNPKWRDIQSMIDMKTANPKAELQTAMQRAQSASNEYLKALGLAGSGMGQSQLSDIGVQYQNALSKINQTAQDEVNNQLAKDLEDAVANGRYSARDVQDFIRQYGEQTGNTESYKNIAENYGATYGQEAERVFDNLNTLINSNEYTLSDKSTVTPTETQKLYAIKLREKLNEAYTNGDQNEFYKILDENINFLNKLDMENNSNSTNSTTEKIEIVNVPEKYQYIDKGNATSKNRWYRIRGTDTYFYRKDNGDVEVIKDGKKITTNMDGLQSLI